jgi:hypothetical protein
VTFKGDGALTMNTLFATNANIYANNIKSIDSRSSGFWVFSFLDFCVYGQSTLNTYYGLIDSANQNGIIFYRATSAYISYKIVQNGSTVYTLNDLGTNDFGQLKISIDANHNIKIYRYSGDVFTQIGTTQTYSLGNLSLFMSSTGVAGLKTSLSYIYIYDKDDNPTQFPTLQKFTGVDIRNFGAVSDGSTDCTTAIELGLATGADIIIKNGSFAYSASIKIPSNRNICYQNARVKKTDGSFDNFFCNENLTTGNTNFSVKGVGCVFLDGNSEHNSDTNYSTYGPLTYPIPENIHKYMGIFICNATNFEISNLVFHHYPHWCFFPQQASYGTIKNIFFNHAFAPTNGDGMNVAWGCHHLNISNIRGYTQDDFMTFAGGKASAIGYNYTNYDIGATHDNIITDIHPYNAGRNAFVLFGELNNAIYNLSFSNIYLRATGNQFLYVSPEITSSAPAKADINNITFDNVTIDSCLATAAILVQQNCENIVMTNLVNNSGKSMISFGAGATDVGDIIINGTYYPVPKFVSGLVADSAPTHIVLTYDQVLDETSVPATTCFTLSGGKACTNVAINGAAKTVTLTADSAYVNGNVITVGYAVPGSNPIKGILGTNNSAIALTAQSISNNIASTYPATPVALWEMNGDLTDSIGSYTLTGSNAVLATDRNSSANKAYSLVTANSAYIYRNSFSQINFTTEFSFSIWFKVDALVNYNVIICNSNIVSGTEGWALMYISSGSKLRFYIDHWSNQKVDINFNDTTSWHHVVVSYKKTGTNGYQARIVLDNGTPAYFACVDNVSYASSTFMIGKGFGPTYFGGSVDQVMAYDRELTLLEITQLYNYYK